jgi:hypothetical protein
VGLSLQRPHDRGKKNGDIELLTTRHTRRQAEGPILHGLQVPVVRAIATGSQDVVVADIEVGEGDAAGA